MISKQTKDLIEEARQPLILDDLKGINKRYHKILTFNPKEVYKVLKAKVNPFKRKNRISTAEVFKNINGLCACGCGKKLQGRRRRWATDDCSKFTFLVISIINGDTSVIRPIIVELYGGEKCLKCNRKDSDFERILDLPKVNWRNKNKKEFATELKQYNRAVHDMASKIHLDHIIPVSQGGGGCWLNNFQFLCNNSDKHDLGCHNIKSREERNPLKQMLEDKQAIHKALQEIKPLPQHIKFVKPF